MNRDVILKDLTEAQREAVTHVDGPLLILAAAGSGKTRVITRRIAYLLSLGIPHQRILAITFTNKAAGEMKERVRALGEERRLWISTFHSFCARILRQHAELLGYGRNYSIYDTDDKTKLIKEILKALELDARNFPPSAIEWRISEAKNGLLDPEDYARQADGFMQRRVAKVYERYQKRLVESNALDFDDLLLQMIRLLREHPEVRQHYQNRFQYILVDEYQDTNQPQYLITKLLASGHKNLCVTGDPDQSIYRWRGADIRNILAFESDFPEAKVVKLEQNYRSTKAILKAADNLIKNNRLRKDKALWTENPEGVRLKVIHLYDEHDEAEEVANHIAELKEKSSRSKDVAVFYRINAQSRVLEQALRSANIPYTIVGGVEFYQRKEVKDVLAYLKLLANPNNLLSFRRIVNAPPRGIGQKSLAVVEEFALANGLTALEAALRSKEISGLKGKAQAGVAAFAQLMEELKALPTYPVKRIVRTTATESGYEDMLKASKAPEAQERLENVQELVGAAQEYDRSEPDGSLEGFLENVSLVADVDKWDDRSDAVTLMTLHAAKGLEFPYVFIVGLEEGLLPHAQSLEDNEELEEERRLCFVGITRAKLGVFLTCAKYRSIFGQELLNRPSRFLEEIPDAVTEKIMKVGSQSEVEKALAEKLEPSPHQEFKVGDRVRHAVFGRGHIVSISGRGSKAMATVRFNVAGEKKLVLEFAKLTKLDY